MPPLSRYYLETRGGSSRFERVGAKGSKKFRWGWSPRSKPHLHPNSIFSSDFGHFILHCSKDDFLFFYQKCDEFSFKGEANRVLAPRSLILAPFALSLGQVSIKDLSRCRPKKNQIIPTIRYRPSVKCRTFTSCHTLLRAASMLIEAGGNVFSHVCCPYTVRRPFRVPPPGAGSHHNFAHVDDADLR